MNKTSFQDPTGMAWLSAKFRFITGIKMFPGRDGTLRVLRHTVACFRVGCAQDPGIEQ